MSRSSNRGGYGSQRGALNPKITVSALEPSNPKNKDIWIDTATNVIYIWNSTTSNWDPGSSLGITYFLDADGKYFITADNKYFITAD